MSHFWRDHIQDAERLLDLAQAEGTSTARRLAVLYQVVVELTGAICDLEAHRDEEAKTGKL